MRILIVEDEVKLAKSLKRGLEKQGYAVDHIENGAEAAEHITVNHVDYDLVLLDLMLPGRSGFDICSSLRERGIMVPIIALTAKHLTSDKIVMLNAGADDYLTKPFAFDELIARVKAIRRRPEEMLPSEYVLGNLRLSPITQKAFINEKPLELTRKEFAILEFFLEHPGQALSREDILAHVWDFNFNSLSNVVDVHVKNLRKKIRDADEGIVIETVDGVGYRLETKVQA